MSCVFGGTRFMRRFPTPCGVLQRMPGGVEFGGARSLIIVADESQLITPPAFPEKVTPVKSALEFTNARIPGPPFCEMFPPRINASEFPSTRMPALRESDELPFPL